MFNSPSQDLMDGSLLVAYHLLYQLLGNEHGYSRDHESYKMNNCSQIAVANVLYSKDFYICFHKLLRSCTLLKIALTTPEGKVAVTQTKNESLID